MKLTDENWAYRCASLREKQALFDHAKDIGFAFHEGSYDDEDLLITWVDSTENFYSFTEAYFQRHGRNVRVTREALETAMHLYKGIELSEKPSLEFDYLHGLNAIYDERSKQVLKGHSTVGGDDYYTDHELHNFARYWLTQPNDVGTRQAIRDLLTAQGWVATAFDYSAKTPEQCLAIAGALIAAELDRLHRLSQK